MTSAKTKTQRSFLCAWSFMGRQSTKSFAIQQGQDPQEAAAAAQQMGLKPHTLVTEVVTEEPWPAI